MDPPLRIRQVQISPLAIPMRMRFEHAAAAREVADPVVVRLCAGAPYAHRVGYGETLARPYVTGETAATVVEDVRKLFMPRLAEFESRTLGDALEQIEALPYDDGGRVINAARAAVELALIDLACRVYRRRAAAVARWLELPGFGGPGALPAARYSGMVVGRSPAKLIWLLRAQRCYGLRDFKIKVAVDGWQTQLERAYRVLGGAIRRGRATLRADANGGWTYEQVCDALPLLAGCGVSALEQPLADDRDSLLPAVAEQAECDLIADESLLTQGDAQRLIQGGAVRVLNVRIAKNGGLLPALKIARAALSAGLDVQLGCLVGETSILSAAGVAFLEACPKVRFVEGAFGRFLLKADVVRPPIRFGYGGRVRARRGDGLGVDVSDDALRRLAAGGGQIQSF